MEDVDEAVLIPGEVVRPHVDNEIVIKLLYELYGMTVISIQELNSYDDRNYLVMVDSNFDNPYVESLRPHGYVLKILNSLDSNHEDAVDARNNMMLHVRKHGIETPRPILNVDGKLKSKVTCQVNSDSRYIVRLFEYLPGRILEGAPYTPDLLFEIGKIAGEIDKACQEFCHPAYEKSRSVWNLTEVPGLTEFCDCITDHNQRLLVDEVIQAFNKEVVSNYNKLKKGIIHADFNEQNIFIRPAKSKDRQFEVAGILDFGDSARTFYIFEISILMCYMMLDSNVLDPFDAGGHTFAGYLSVFPLEPFDLKVLKECISARMTQSLIVGLYSAKRNPDNTDYILKTSGRGWKFLQNLWIKPKDELYVIFKKCADEYGISVKFS